MRFNTYCLVIKMDIVYLGPEELKTHPYRKRWLFPIQGKERDFLKQSIKKDGIKDGQPIVVNEDNLILDGHDRRDIAIELGLKMVPVDVKKGLTLKEEKLFIIEHTLDRKHIDKGTRAMMAAEYDTLKRGGNAVTRPRTEQGRFKPEGSEVPTGQPTIPEIAKKFNISEKTLDRAKIIKESTKIPETIKQKVREGVLPVAPVAALEKKPVEVIKKVEEKVIKSGKTINRAVREAEGRIKTFKTTSLPFRANHIDLIRAGVKVQTSRQRPPVELKAGDVVDAVLWNPNAAKLKVVSVEKKRLGDFTEDDAQREGGYTLEEFKDVWIKINGKWNDNQTVTVIQFEKV